jgi:hypothetical protein
VRHTGPEDASSGATPAGALTRCCSLLSTSPSRKPAGLWLQPAAFVLRSVFCFVFDALIVLSKPNGTGTTRNEFATSTHITDVHPRLSMFATSSVPPAHQMGRTPLK